MSTTLKGREFHLIGIGGAGMSVLAELLLAAGATVSGSDRNDSDVLVGLRDSGIRAFSPHGAHEFPETATVVVSSAIRPDNVELRMAESRGQKVIHRSEALALVAASHELVAVAGAHGKTSTSAMLAVTLLRGGFDPTFAIGGKLLDLGTGARLGGNVFIAEADESDGSFLNYSPRIAVVTNVEPDHLDHFGSQHAVEEAFDQFVGNIVEGGYLVACEEDAGSAALAGRARRQLDEVGVVTYGRAEHSSKEPDVRVSQVSLGAFGAEATFEFRGEKGKVALQVTGFHNVLNAAAAWTTAVLLGMSGERAATALEAYVGTGRRFEVGEAIRGRRLVHDYAHHPTELQAALQQARLLAGDGRVIAVFQPHLYSRTQTFTDELVKALNLADEVVVADIFPAREDPIPGVVPELLVDHSDVEASFHLGGHADDAAVLGAKLTRDSDVCLLIGAGDINERGPLVEEHWHALEER